MSYDSNPYTSQSIFQAFLMRPFGGMIIGYMGDKYGRKYALVLSLFLMAIPTFVMGCLESPRLYFFVLCIRVVNMKSGDLATHLTFICLI